MKDLEQISRVVVNGKGIHNRVRSTQRNRNESTIHLKQIQKKQEVVTKVLKTVNQETIQTI